MAMSACAASANAEVAALPVLARGSALRFMLTRLVDWLNVPPGAKVVPKDPLEYLEQDALPSERGERPRLWPAAMSAPRFDLDRRGLFGQSRPGRLGRGADL